MCDHGSVISLEGHAGERAQCDLQLQGASCSLCSMMLMAAPLITGRSVGSEVRVTVESWHVSWIGCVMLFPLARGWFICG